MQGIALVILLGLTACVAADAIAPASASTEARGWQDASGKPPSRAEFAAVLAACQDRAAIKKNDAALDGCLADLGLRRVQ
ncbi:MAG TPA: hypothetical protein VGF34_19085 [Stellaceae bacterium]|jgi:hypothetical protein